MSKVAMEAMYKPELLCERAERDSFGNHPLSGNGVLGDYLAGVVKAALEAHLGKEGLAKLPDGKLRVRADTFGYSQRCFPEVVSKVDAEEAMQVAKEAVRVAVSDEHPNGSIAIKKAGTAKTYAVSYGWTSLESVAPPDESEKPGEPKKKVKNTRCMPDEFINAEGNGVTEAFRDYALPLIGRLPRYGWLKNKPV